MYQVALVYFGPTKAASSRFPLLWFYMEARRGEFHLCMPVGNWVVHPRPRTHPEPPGLTGPGVRLCRAPIASRGPELGRALTSRAPKLGLSRGLVPGSVTGTQTHQSSSMLTHTRVYPFSIKVLIIG